MRTSETYEQSYLGNASAVTPYPITFQFIEAADLELIVTNSVGVQTILAQPADYVVTRDHVTELGSFMTTVAIPATSTLKIYRANQLTQQLDYVNSDTFPADSHEQNADRFVESLQAVRAMAARALRVSPGDAELEFEASGSPPNTVAGLGSLGEFLFRSAAEMVSFLSLPSPVLNMPTKTWANDGERTVAIPDFLGQIASQRNTMATYVSTGLSAGNWVLTTAGGVSDLSITRDKLADGALAADSIGRAKMADLYVTFAKMGIDFITAMTAKTLLESGDYVAGWSASDNAYRKFAGSSVIPLGSVIQTVSATPYVANTNIITVIPWDDTVPQITEGTQILTLSITPQFSTSRIRLTFNGFGTRNTGGDILAVLFKVPVSNCLKPTVQYVDAANFRRELNIDWIDSPATTTATTYTIRVGPGQAGTMRLNGSTAARFLGGSAACTLVAQEIKG